MGNHHADEDIKAFEAREAKRRAEGDTIDPRKRIELANELLTRLIDDIGTGPALSKLRADAHRIQQVLRGLDW